MRRKTILASAVVAFSLIAGTALAGHVFPDVADDNVHLSNIEWAKETGLFVGYDDGTFGPSDPITRAQMTTVFKRYHDKLDKTGANVDEIINEVINEITLEGTDICEVFGFESPCAAELKEFLRGPAGSDGADGADGSDGAPGAPGADGADGVTGYTVINTEVRWSDGPGESIILCPEGKFALGGGYEIDSIRGGVATLTDNGPVWADFKALGWRVTGSAVGEANVKAWVTCATVGS